MKKKDKVTIGIVCFALLLTGAVLLTTGKKSENKTENGNVVLDEDVLFEGLGNNQGNTENGGEQTWLDRGYILLKLSLDDSESRMVFFNTSDGTLGLACEDSTCLHTGSLCSSKQLFQYLVSWSDTYYGVSDTYRKEILKCTDSEVTCFYKADNDIYGLWGYEGYLYFSTDYGVFRVALGGEAEAEQVLDSPILVGQMLTFYEDRMYFCDEDRFLYSAALDGTDKKRLSDGMAYYPQIHDDRIFYRSAQYDADGVYEMENTLCSISLDGEDKQIVLDEVYQFNCLDDRIYYITLPNDGETTLYSIEYDGTDCREIVDCQAGYLYVFDETDWILYMKTDGELPEDEVGGKPGHLYCIKKDGTQETRLDYPQVIGE
ncbi:MAG: DUF5050 domain-containing protein [Lachnospiraceae bacterium]|nr:DUF5050 domain-containing protein [Lachnospiraceae bacterium]